MALFKKQEKKLTPKKAVLMCLLMIVLSYLFHAILGSPVNHIVCVVAPILATLSMYAVFGVRDGVK